jgi:2-succinyl-5-enolpyruvyl-6-hydroxy-3-cyclohexene-1-carboxylate synthase
MSPGDVSFACAAALVDALASGGVRHACVSPGSRSTPLALALARDDRVTLHVHLDERSAGFFALGSAKATDDPVVLACTSGTAAAEYFPAIVEASQSRTPLIVLTADRPPAQRGSGANQTIDQVDLYGRYARAYLEPPMPTSTDDIEPWFDSGVRAIAEAQGAPRGPVQVNCSFDEPLAPADDLTTRSARAVAVADRRDDMDAVAIALDAFVERSRGKRGVITLGGSPAPTALSLLSLGSLLGWPVLAEPLSGLRLDAGDAGRALAAGQFLIDGRDRLERNRPDVVLQVGATPTTRATQALVAAADTLVVLDRDHLDPDPAARAERRISADPELFASMAWDARDQLSRGSTDPAWLEGWRAADLVARATVDRELDRWEEPFEGRVARDVASFLPHGATLVVGSSTPVRDLDMFMAPRRPPRIWNAPDLLRVIGNRGASGIDGLVSTTLGVAAGSPGPTVALLGDLSFLYDAGALLWSSRLGVDAVFVVLANGGGQIFSMLDQATLPEFDELFLTPHPASIEKVSEAADAGYHPVVRASDLTTALEQAIRDGGVQIIEVTIDAERDRARRAGLRERVHAVLASR